MRTEVDLHCFLMQTVRWDIYFYDDDALNIDGAGSLNNPANFQNLNPSFYWSGTEIAAGSQQRLGLRFQQWLPGRGQYGRQQLCVGSSSRRCCRRPQCQNPQPLHFLVLVWQAW